MNDISASEFFGNNTMEHGFHTRFVKLQPGLAVVLYEGDGHNILRMNVQNDSTYIHFSCLLQGRVDAIVDGQELSPPIGGGGIGYLPGKKFSAYCSADYRSVELMVAPERLVELAGEEFEQIGCDIRDRSFLRTCAPGQRSLDAAIRLAEHIENSDSERLLLHAVALEFMAWRFKNIGAGLASDVFTVQERKQLQEARAYLLADLSEPPTIANLAQEIGLNQFKLKRGFKLMFGASIFVTFQRERMEHARHLLKNHNVTETAMTLGYSNVSHFSSAFRKQYGVLPSELRMKLN